jgi:L-threonylcarbamoyladenylate synthase
MPNVLKIDPEKPAPNLIKEAIRILKTGGVVAYPTETFYGLAADAGNEAAVEKLFRIKGRDFRNPVALIAASESQLGDLTAEIPDMARLLMETFWPGPLTLVFRTSRHVNTRLTADTGKIGVRISSHPLAAALAAGLGRPITATSANLSGRPECVSAPEVRRCLGHLIDLMIDGGATPGGKGSTFIDMTTHPPRMLREGAISVSDIAATCKEFPALIFI